jgi:uncharacterized protein (DUF4415 family)
MYKVRMMKKRKRVRPGSVRKGKVQKKISRLQASASASRRAPELTEYFKPIKKAVTLRLDADVLAWFQRQGRGYQTRINRALRELMDARKKS